MAGGGFIAGICGALAVDAVHHGLRLRQRVLHIVEQGAGAVLGVQHGGHRGPAWGRGSELDRWAADIKWT